MRGKYSPTGSWPLMCMVTEVFSETKFNVSAGSGVDHFE
jgi:hypothetical protein